MKKIYIAGKVTDEPAEKVRAKFIVAECELKQLGYEVVNPFAITDCKGFTWFDYLLRDMIYLQRCDAVYMLNDWEDSHGARAEKEIAEGLGLEVIYQNKEATI